MAILKELVYIFERVSVLEFWSAASAKPAVPFIPRNCLIFRLVNELDPNALHDITFAYTEAGTYT